jgi:hypothetical protein
MAAAPALLPRRPGALHDPAALALDGPVDSPAARRAALDEIDQAYIRDKSGLVYDYHTFSDCTWRNPRCTYASHNAFINHYWLRQALPRRPLGDGRRIQRGLGCDWQLPPSQRRNLDTYYFGVWDFHLIGYDRCACALLLDTGPASVCCSADCGPTSIHLPTAPSGYRPRRWSINMFVFNSSDIITPIEVHDDEVRIAGRSAAGHSSRQSDRLLRGFNLLGAGWRAPGAWHRLTAGFGRSCRHRPGSATSYPRG